MSDGGLSLLHSSLAPSRQHRPRQRSGRARRSVLIVLPDTIAGLLRLRASRRSGPISLLAAWASHEADHPLQTDTVRPLWSLLYPPLRTVLSILLGPRTSVHNRERPLSVYASVMLLLTTQLF